MLIHQTRDEQFCALQRGYAGNPERVPSMQNCLSDLKVDCTDRIIRDTLLNGIVDEDIRRDLLGTADILISPINTMIASVKSKETARNAVPLTDFATLLTFKRSTPTKTTAHRSPIASARHLSPTFMDQYAQSHSPRCNQLFSLFKEGPQGWNTKPYSGRLSCYRACRRQKRRNAHADDISLQAIQPSDTE